MVDIISIESQPNYESQQPKTSFPEFKTAYETGEWFVIKGKDTFFLQNPKTKAIFGKELSNANDQEGADNRAKLFNMEQSQFEKNYKEEVVTAKTATLDDLKNTEKETQKSQTQDELKKEKEKIETELPKPSVEKETLDKWTAIELSVKALRNHLNETIDKGNLNIIQREKYHILELTLEQDLRFLANARAGGAHSDQYYQPYKDHYDNIKYLAEAVIHEPHTPLGDLDIGFDTTTKRDNRLMLRHMRIMYKEYLKLNKQTMKMAIGSSAIAESQNINFWLEGVVNGNIDPTAQRYRPLPETTDADFAELMRVGNHYREFAPWRKVVNEKGYPANNPTITNPDKTKVNLTVPVAIPSLSAAQIEALKGSDTYTDLSDAFKKHGLEGMIDYGMIQMGAGVDMRRRAQTMGNIAMLIGGWYLAYKLIGGLRSTEGEGDKKHWTGRRSALGIAGAVVFWPQILQTIKGGETSRWMGEGLEKLLGIKKETGITNEYQGMGATMLIYDGIPFVDYKNSSLMNPDGTTNLTNLKNYRQQKRATADVVMARKIDQQIAMIDTMTTTNTGSSINTQLASMRMTRAEVTNPTNSTKTIKDYVTPAMEAQLKIANEWDGTTDHASINKSLTDMRANMDASTVPDFDKAEPSLKSEIQNLRIKNPNGRPYAVNYNADGKLELTSYGVTTPITFRNGLYQIQDNKQEGLFKNGFKSIDEAVRMANLTNFAVNTMANKARKSATPRNVSALGGDLEFEQQTITAVLHGENPGRGDTTFLDVNDKTRALYEGITSDKKVMQEYADWLNSMKIWYKYDGAKPIKAEDYEAGLTATEIQKLRDGKASLVAYMDTHRYSIKDDAGALIRFEDRNGKDQKATQTDTKKLKLQEMMKNGVTDASLATLAGDDKFFTYDKNKSPYLKNATGVTGTIEPNLASAPITLENKYTLSAMAEVLRAKGEKVEIALESANHKANLKIDGTPTLIDLDNHTIDGLKTQDGKAMQFESLEDLVLTAELTSNLRKLKGTTSSARPFSEWGRLNNNGGINRETQSRSSIFQNIYFQNYDWTKGITAGATVYVGLASMGPAGLFIGALVGPQLGEFNKVLVADVKSGKTVSEAMQHAMSMPQYANFFDKNAVQATDMAQYKTINKDDNRKAYMTYLNDLGGWEK